MHKLFIFFIILLPLLEASKQYGTAEDIVTLHPETLKQLHAGKKATLIFHEGE